MTRPPQGLRLVSLTKRFGESVAVDSFNLEVRAGELLVLVGPSGCGKSTLVRLIAGLDHPSEGDVWIGGRRVNDLEPGERDVAMVFQSYALYPHMSVAGNLGFGLKARGAPRLEVRRRVTEVAGALGLDDLLNRRPAQLSGGQRQRVALGRALVRAPGVFLLDEPLSNLDARLRLRTRDGIAELQRKLGTTMIFVTHDQSEALSLGERVAVMNAGRLHQVGSPTEVYDRPHDLFVAGFLGAPRINLAHLQRNDAGSLAGGPFTLEERWPWPDATLAVRPEDLYPAPSPSDADLFASIVRIEPLGSEQLVHLRTEPEASQGGDAGHGELTWVMRSPPAQRFTVGDRLPLAVHWERTHMFGPDGTRVVEWDGRAR